MHPTVTWLRNLDFSEPPRNDGGGKLISPFWFMGNLGCPNVSLLGVYTTVKRTVSIPTRIISAIWSYSICNSPWRFTCTKTRWQKPMSKINREWKITHSKLKVNFCFWIKISKLTFPSSSKKKILFSSRLQITSPHLRPHPTLKRSADPPVSKTLHRVPRGQRWSVFFSNKHTNTEYHLLVLISFVDEHIQTMGFEEI